jgi:hypothetical protein
MPPTGQLFYEARLCGDGMLQPENRRTIAVDSPTDYKAQIDAGYPVFSSGRTAVASAMPIRQRSMHTRDHLVHEMPGAVLCRHGY